MTKRAEGKFKRNERDFYPTPIKAIEPLLEQLDDGTVFIEPCAGDGAIVNYLTDNGHKCIYASDIYPLTDWIAKKDIYDIEDSLLNQYTVITNTPWDRKFVSDLLDRIIENNGEAWLLLDADLMHNKWMAKYMQYCSHVVTCGRVKWIEDSKSSGFNNSCWYRFVADNDFTIFIGKNYEGE